MKRIIFVLSLTLVLTSCAIYSLVPAKRVEVNGAFSVQPTSEWSKRSVGDLELWTQDGSSLQELVFVTGISDGDTLFPTATGGASERTLPEYDEKMSSPELLEYFKASFSAIQMQDIRDKVFEPTKFGGTDGFHIEFDVASDKGLEYRAIVYGAVRNKKLYSVIFYGTRLHYFDKLQAEVKNIVSSLKFI